MSAQDLKAAINEYVRSKWKSVERATLLSELGAHLASKGLWPRRGEPKESLREVIEHNLSAELRIEQKPGNRLIVGVFPRDADLTTDMAGYFTAPPRPTAGGTDQLPRYLPYFWAAFAKPLPPGHRRFITPNARAFFEMSDNEKYLVAPDEYEVLATDIPPEVVEDRVTQIAAHIRKWSERIGIDLTLFQQHEPQRPPTLRGVRPPSDARTALDRFLDALSPKDLHRIQIPLDLIDKLRRHRE